MNDRAAEIVEAVLLLHDLGKPDQFIGHQMELTVPEVQTVLKTGWLPVRQKELFAAEPSVQKNRPESSWERVVQVCKIHSPGKATNRTP